MMRTRRAYRGQSAGGRGAALGLRLIIGLVIAGIALFSFLSSREFNPVTGEDQYLSLTPQQEIALGLQSVPEIYQQFGPEYRDPQVQALVDEVGDRIVTQTIAAETPWQFEFHVLDNPDVVNAFALPGGQIFITTALLNEFTTEDQLAAVLGHEIVHVLARHSAQQIAKSDLASGVIGAVTVASGSADAAQTAAMVAQIVQLGYGRDDELQSDAVGVCLMFNTGYDPRAMSEVMQILARAGGGSNQPEFFSTHPNPDNRIARIEEAIAEAPNRCPQYDA